MLLSLINDRDGISTSDVVEDTSVAASSENEDTNLVLSPVPEKSSAASIHSVPAKKTISWWDYVGLGDSGGSTQSLPLGNVDRDVDMSHDG